MVETTSCKSLCHRTLANNMSRRKSVSARFFSFISDGHMKPNFASKLILPVPSILLDGQRRVRINWVKAFPLPQPIYFHSEQHCRWKSHRMTRNTLGPFFFWGNVFQVFNPRKFAWKVAGHSRHDFGHERHKTPRNPTKHHETPRNPTNLHEC